MCSWGPGPPLGRSVFRTEEEEGFYLVWVIILGSLEVCSSRNKLALEKLSPY